MVSTISRRLPTAIGLILVTVLVGGWGLFGQNDTDVGEVTVSATQIADSLVQAPPALSVVSGDELLARGVSTVAEALKTATGLSLNDTGPAGAQKTISLRGSTSNQVLVLIDGVRANETMSGLANVANLPAADIERIEVVRSGSSAAFGGDALGGVVNIITKTSAQPLRITITNGSYLPSVQVSGFGFQKQAEAPNWMDLVDSQLVSLSVAPKMGDAILHFSAHGERAANAYRFLDSNLENRRRENAGLLAANGTLGLVLPLGDAHLRLDSAGSIQQIGVPGSMNAPTLQASETDSTIRVNASFLADRFFSDLLNLNARLATNWQDIDYTDLESPANNGRHQTLSLEAVLSQQAFVADACTLAYGLTGAFTQVASTNVGQPQRWNAGVWFEPGLDFGALSLRPAVRWDYYSDFSGNDPLGSLAGSLGASYRLTPGDSLKFNLNRAYRVPTFSDLYWPASNGAAGNPALKPETGYGLDLGYTHEESAMRYTASLYARYAFDVILWQPGSDGVWRPSNYGAALYPGLEQEFSAHFAEWFDISVNYAFLYSFLLDEGLSLASDKRLPQTPVHSLNGTLGFKREGFSWSASAKFQSLRYLAVANTAYLNACFTLDLFLKQELDKNFALNLALTNLFDEQYQLVKGYPMPPTKISLGQEVNM